MKIPRYLFLTLAAACAAPSGLHAHISYNNRNFGTNPVSMTISNQAASSAFGWADATDADWGDSHRGRFFRFTLTTPASIMISVTRGGSSAQTGAADTFLPGISLFAGLSQTAPEALAHDSSTLSVASRPVGTEGSFRSLTDWSIGNNDTYNTTGDPTSGVLYAARLANFTYVGHLADGTSANYGTEPGIVGDGNADGSVTATFNELAAGDYSFFVGGANYDAQLTETGPTTYPTYAFTATVQTVPEPSTWALLAFGVLAGAGVLRKKWRR
ncbi:MAG: PEP-CTERM sorting domain-containing protein [Chthoniobacterales bacterium]